MSSLEIELGDDTYEVEVTSFEPPRSSRRGSPDGWFEDGGEIDIGPTVKVWGLDFRVTGPGSGNSVPAVVDVISLEDFLKLYAEYHGIPQDLGTGMELGKAMARLQDECFEALMREREDSFDDRY